MYIFENNLILNLFLWHFISFNPFSNYLIICDSCWWNSSGALERPNFHQKLQQERELWHKQSGYAGGIEYMAQSAKVISDFKFVTSPANWLFLKIRQNKIFLQNMTHVKQHGEIDGTLFVEDEVLWEGLGNEHLKVSL